MKKPIFVRPLTHAEQHALHEGLRSSDAFVLRRCQILLASARGQRDRLLRLAATPPDWVLGCADAVWWSRLAQPAMHSWAAPDQALRLIEKALAKDEPDPKALACYGLLLRATSPTPEQLWRRCATGQLVSALTLRFLAWSCDRLAAQGTHAWLLVWDNAAWHKSPLVRTGLRAHNHHVKRRGRGVRILVCWLPSQSLWLNPIEPKWVHGKRAVMEPAC